MDFSDMMDGVASAFQAMAEAINALVEKFWEAYSQGKFDEFEDLATEIGAVREKPEYPIITVITAHSTGLRSKTVTRTLIPL